MAVGAGDPHTEGEVGRRWPVALVAVGVGVFAVAIVGALVAAALTGGADDDPEGVSAPLGGGDPVATAVAPSTTTATAAPTTTTTVVDETRILLAWASGGLPAGFADGAAARPEVERMTIVRGGQADLLRSATADGTVVDVTPDGWAYPLDALAIDPDSFAGFTNDPDDRALMAALAPGAALLTESSAALRRVDVGATLEMRGGQLVVAGIISDRGGAESELVVHAADAERLGIATERYVLIVHDPAVRGALDPVLQDLARPKPLYLRTLAETTRLRHGDSVVPLVHVKQAFGEFTYRDRSGRAVEIDPAWIDAHLVWARVPILGEVRCHEAMIEPLSAALGQLEAEGLAHVIDPAAFSGCWNARRIREGMPLSKHAWGLAVDVNIDGNPYGDFATQHPRFVELMREHGFTWGGDWMVPDPGHYELDP